MEQRAIQLLHELHVHLPSVRDQVATLAGGQRQSVAVSREVMWNSQVVLLVEPNGGLICGGVKGVGNITYLAI
jgi:D-xylose transport system ATP-binding protein